MSTTLQSLSDSQLRTVLLTVDGQGKAVKIAVLEELLERARQEARL